MMSETGKVSVKVEVEINPTEDIDKVQVTVQKMLGELQLEVVEEDKSKRLVGRAEGQGALSKFQELLRKERIRNAARRVFYDGLRGNTITFYLNKQVSYVGHISFSQSVGESPLGPIHVEIQCENPRDLIDWLAPRIT